MERIKRQRRIKLLLKWALFFCLLWLILDFSLEAVVSALSMWSQLMMIEREDIAPSSCAELADPLSKDKTLAQ